MVLNIRTEYEFEPDFKKSILVSFPCAHVNFKSLTLERWMDTTKRHDSPSIQTSLRIYESGSQVFGFSLFLQN